MYSRSPRQIRLAHLGNLAAVTAPQYSGTMGLQCFLFSSDEGTAATIRHVLAGLDVQVESCPEAVRAVEMISKQAFQIVIIDWDRQPEAGLLLSTARERKASERPITLAIVSNDASVAKALQAGANSILRTPIVINQVTDTLRTARDLLRSRRDPAAPAVVRASGLGAAAAVAPSTIPLSMEPGKEKTLRAGEFLQSGPAMPGGAFETEANTPGTFDQPAAEPVDPLKDLEPVAASVAEQKPDNEAVPPPQPGETRGLEWYLKTRGVTRQNTPPAPPLSSAPNAKPELLGFDQSPPVSSVSPASISDDNPFLAKPKQPTVSDQKKEAELFAYIDEGGQSEESAPSGFRLGKGAIIGALLLASCAIAAAPQAPWHPKTQLLWARGQRALHAWLNPQPVTPTQAPVSHEDFARAGDEYKLPVAENIPDATTDPSQIRVVPVIDPTAKKLPADAANADQPPPDASTTAPTDQPQNPGAQNPGVQVVENQQAQTAPPTANTTSPVTAAPVTTAAPAHVETAAPAAVSLPAAQPPVQKPSPVQYVSTPAGKIPSSLKSQMASSTPDAGGNRPVESAMPSIEPVAVAEGVERSLLSDQPALPYPANAKGQQGTVILQVLVGRDGTVQDAKFLQGSLAFARAAIDGVKLWKFKPYTMNGHPVSVQTLMTISFKPPS